MATPTTSPATVLSSWASDEKRHKLGDLNRNLLPHCSGGQKKVKIKASLGLAPSEAAGEGWVPGSLPAPGGLRCSLA